MLSFPIGSFSFRKHGTGRQPWGGHYIREAGLVGLVRAIGVGVRFSLFLEALGGTARGDNLGACKGSIPYAPRALSGLAKSSIVGSAPTVVR